MCNQMRLALFNYALKNRVKSVAVSGGWDGVGRGAQDDNVWLSVFLITYLLVDVVTL